MAAPLSRWLAYVWPAIALGPVGEALTMTWALRLTRLERAFPLPASGILGSLSLPTGAAGPGDASQPSPASRGAEASRPGPLDRLTPHGGGMSLLVTAITVLAALIGVVALARLAVGEDLFSSRWLHRP